MFGHTTTTITTPLSPSDSQRSREMSWSSVFVTPHKAVGRTPNRFGGGRGLLEEDPTRPQPATVAHRSA